MVRPYSCLLRLCIALACAVALTAVPAAGDLLLGPEQLVEADGQYLTVLGYSVPSFVDWNNDGLNDLVIGEGGGGVPDAKVRVYLNIGTASSPAFAQASSFYVQSVGADLTYVGAECSPCACLGLFPRVVYWDADNRKDLLIGQADGTVRIYLNTGTDQAPSFDGGAFLQVGPAGTKVDVDIGIRATPTVVDWNSDGRKDLAIGAYDGKVHIYLNEGTDTAPDFVSETFAQQNGADLIVYSGRGSPWIGDLDGDGKKDLLTGNTFGELRFYHNVGTDEAPSFTGAIGGVLVEAGGVVIDLEGDARSRPFVCDWTGDGLTDVIIGASDGRVHLYQGVPEPATLALLALGGAALLGRRRR